MLHSSGESLLPPRRGILSSFGRPNPTFRRTLNTWLRMSKSLSGYGISSNLSWFVYGVVTFPKVGLYEPRSRPPPVVLYLWKSCMMARLSPTQEAEFFEN